MWAQAFPMLNALSSGRLKMRSLVKSWKSVRMQLLGARIEKTRGRYAFQGSLDSEGLRKVKKSKMKKNAIKDIVYGGLEEILSNKEYYHYSSMSYSNHELTEEGKEAMIEFINLMAAKIKQAEQDDLDFRAKKQVMENLKI
jgi:hypothetical protein